MFLVRKFSEDDIGPPDQVVILKGDVAGLQAVNLTALSQGILPLGVDQIPCLYGCVLDKWWQWTRRVHQIQHTPILTHGSLEVWCVEIGNFV